MAVNDNPPPPPPPVNMEKPFGVTNIKSHVPLVLDHDQLNYDAWCELFTSHCHSFGVHGLLDGTFVSTSDNATEWKKLDSLINVWIYGTISTSLLQTVLKKNVAAKDVWKSLADLFHNNKEARSMELHEELRSLELGSLSISKKSRLSRKQGCDNARDTSSSTVLLASHNGAHNKGSANKDLCRNFQRGSAAQWNNTTCRVMHGHRVTFFPTRPGLMAYAPNQNRGMHNNMHGGNMWSDSPILNGSRGILGTTPSNGPQVAFGPTRVQNPTSQANYNWGPHVVYGPYVDQATSLPQAFNTMIVQDYGDFGWYMDTSATSHIASDADTDDNPSPISIRLLTTPNSPNEPNTTTLDPNPTPPATEPNITNNSHHSHTNTNSPTVNIPTESTPHPSDPTPHSQPPTAQPQHTRPNPTTSQQQPVQNTSQKHPMVTRSKVGIVKSNPKFSMHVSTTSPVPRSHIHALHDPNWKHAMLDEYNALITNGTWVLVPRPQNVNVVRSMWLFKHKFHADGSLSRYKARLVANGRSQQQGIDCDETFSPVVKPATIRTVLSLAPPGFVDPAHPNHVCLLQKSLYGLKQAPHAWFQRFASYATRVGFQYSGIDSSLFVYQQSTDTAYLLLYVDDIILTASSISLL
ncbi:ribonuclease H-like domain-containing protein [Tanacetum coccineum]